MISVAEADARLAAHVRPLPAVDVPLAEANRIALDAVFDAFSNPESREGVTAFVEKRKPSYVVDEGTA